MSVGLQGLDRFKLDANNGITIKSIQRGMSTINGSNITLTVSISAVDTSKSIIKLSVNGSGNAPNLTCVKGTLASSTQLTLSRNTQNGSDYVNVYWEVIEFLSVLSVQKGTTNLADGSSGSGAIISTINMDKSTMFFNFSSSDPTAGFYSVIVSGNISNSTQIAFNRVESTGALTINWFVLTFL